MLETPNPEHQHNARTVDWSEVYYIQDDFVLQIAKRPNNMLAHTLS
jgi:hypothetical protein